MPLKRRGKWYHLSEKVNGVKVREALGTKDHRLAKQLFKERIAELMRSNPDPSKVARGYTKMTIAEAVDAYANERRKKAWQKIRAKAGLGNFRFYDGRHTVITTLQEKGVPDWVIQAQVGHVSAEEAKPYSHIRRKALDQVALLLEPAWMYSAKVEDRSDVQRPVSAQTGAQSCDMTGELIDSIERGMVGATGLEPVTSAV